MATKRCRLYVEIEFNIRKTDADSLASAMDALMKTAISTPGILDEYGNPKIGEFLVAVQPHVVCEVEGGLVQAAKANVPVLFEVLDRDNEKESKLENDRGEAAHYAKLNKLLKELPETVY